MMTIRPLAIATVLVLAGCSHDMSDLNQYIDEIKARPARPIDPIPQMKPYEPFQYARQNERDPFKPLIDDLADADLQARAPGSGLQPDFSRNKEPLELFSLDGLRMLGLLESKDGRYALVKAPDGIVHRVQIGDHMGQNYGTVVGVSEIEVQLEEIVPDGFGSYVKRPATLAIQDESDR